MIYYKKKNTKIIKAYISASNTLYILEQKIYLIFMKKMIWWMNKNRI